MRVFFVFVGEGSSDAGLVQHLQSLCVEAGIEEATGIAPDLGLLPTPPGKDAESQVQAALALEPGANLVFVHRDSDNRDAKPRREEIQSALANLNVPFVSVVPIQEMEAWLLLDEEQIRFVSGKPNGRRDLMLPAHARVEEFASPKEKLKEALAIASELRGRRLEKFKKRFPRQRAVLLERLDLNGPVATLTAMRTLKNDIHAVVQELEEAHATTDS